MTKVRALEILLVTSRDTGRWIIPKGWPIKGLKPSKSAAREAYEEAGIRGAIAKKAIGRFTYEKRLDDQSRSVACEVQVFSLRVKRQLKDWPEAGEREVRWFAPSNATALVAEDGLRDLIALWVAQKADLTSSRVSGEAPS